jgi:hypothetical protein
MSLTFSKADVQFKVGSKLVKFSVVHNLPEIFGLHFEGALTNWLVRTDTFTAKSLCKYINQKQDEYVCMTIKTWNRLNKNDNTET